MAVHLTFKKRFRNRTAVNYDQGFFGSLTQAMHRMSRHLLACPRAAGYQNRIIIQDNSGYFTTDATAQYQVRITITSPADGVYFGSAGAVVNESDSAVADLTDCTSAGSNVGASFTAYLSDGVTPVTSFDSDCSVGSASRATILLSSDSPGFTGLDDANQLWVNAPALVFDTSLVSPNDVVTLQVDLIQLPCTTIYSCTRDIGTFVSSCAAAPTAINLTMPYFPAINDSVWWSGAALSNCGSTDATCTLTFNEKDGDIGTYDVTVPAGGMWNTLWASILSSITPDAGNSGTLGDEKFFVCISCTGSSSVKGLAMFGDAQTGQSLGAAIGPTCP